MVHHCLKDSHFMQTSAADRQQKKKHVVESKLGRGLPCLGIVQSPLSRHYLQFKGSWEDRQRQDTDRHKERHRQRPYTLKSEHASHACSGNNAVLPYPYVSSSSRVGHLVLTLDIRLASIIKRFAVWTEQTSKHYSEMM